MFNYLIKYGSRFIYFFMKLKTTKNNKIVFISRLSNNKSLDFELLENKLLKENKNYELVFLCKRITSFKNDLYGNIKYMISCLSNLSNAKVCVTDSFIPAISCVKHKKELKIIQIWHSMGAIKKFAYQSLGTESGRDIKTAKILNMHGNYNYIISGSKNMSKYFSLAFNYDEKYFLNYGLPRMDYLIENEKKLTKNAQFKYPILKKKKNILYAPTFRTYDDDNKTVELIKCIDYDKYNLIVKCHANQELELNKNVLTCKDISALDLIPVSDFIITDYSGIAIEAAILNKKTFYYVYDYNKYKKSNGLNIDLYKEMPGYVFTDAKKLFDCLENSKYDMNKLLTYKNKYIDVQDGTSTQKIVNLIINCLEEK